MRAQAEMQRLLAMADLQVCACVGRFRFSWGTLERPPCCCLSHSSRSTLKLLRSWGRCAQQQHQEDPVDD